MQTSAFLLAKLALPAFSSVCVCNESAATRTPVNTARLPEATLVAYAPLARPMGSGRIRSRSSVMTTKAPCPSSLATASRLASRITQTGTHRRGTSRGQSQRKLALVDRVRGEPERSENVVTGERRIVGEDLIETVALSEQADNGGNGNSRTSDARDTAHHPVVDHNSIRHRPIIAWIAWWALHRRPDGARSTRCCSPTSMASSPSWQHTNTIVEISRGVYPKADAPPTGPAQRAPSELLRTRRRRAVPLRPGAPDPQGHAAGSTRPAGSRHAARTWRRPCQPPDRPGFLWPPRETRTSGPRRCGSGQTATVLGWHDGNRTGDRVAIGGPVTSSNAEHLPAWFHGDDLVPAEELARQQGVQPVRSIEDLAIPGAFESDQEWQDFLEDLYASRRSDLA